MPISELEGVLESCLYVENLEEAERFYRDVLGLALQSRSEGRHVFFVCAQQMVLLFNPAATGRLPDPGGLPIPPHAAHGAGHLCFQAAEGALPEWRAHLAKAGVAIEQEIVWPSGRTSIYFRDPAGNSLEIAEKRLWFQSGT